jgi:hypothetical protein
MGNISDHKDSNHIAYMYEFESADEAEAQWSEHKNTPQLGTEG